MPKARHFQSSFNSGVLDPRLKARVDVKAFYQGAEKLDNCICLPHGGVSRRPGLEYIGTLLKQVSRETGQTITTPRGGTGANANDDDDTTDLVTTTSIGVLNPYIVVHYDLGSAKTVLFADVVDMSLTTSANTEFFIQYSTDNSTFTDFGAKLNLSSSARTERRSGPVSARYWRVARIGATDLTTEKATLAEFSLWTESTAVSDYRLIPFSFNTEQSYMLVASDRNIRVYKDDLALIDIRTDITSAQLDNIDWTQSADTLLIVEQDLTPMQIVRDTTAEGIWDVSDMSLTNIPQHDFGGGAESAWSTTRGWPLTVTFFEGRCIFGGSKSRPQGIWMTKSNAFYDFDLGTSQPDESIHVNLDTDQVNEIRHINPGRKLEIITSGGEFVVPESPMTPEAISIRRQTKFGALPVNVASIDGSTIYVQRNGRGLREFLFSFTEDAYVSNSVTQLSSHLIDSPVDMDATAGTLNEETNYIYVVNQSGNVVVFNTLREQEIAAWSGPWTTEGMFKRVGVLDTTTYFAVERTINNKSVTYLEKLNANAYTDSASLGDGLFSATISGLGHLEGESVRVKADLAIQSNKTVSSGSITLSQSTESYEVGLNFNPLIKTMPVSDGFADGPTLNKLKRIIKCQANCYQTLGVHINGERVPDRTFGVETFDEVAVADNDTRELYLLGWTEEAQVEITQVDPVPMTILAADLEVQA